MKLPSELEINSIPYPSPENILAALQEALNPGSMPQSPTPDDGNTAKALVHLANQIWRMNATLIDPESGEAKASLSAQEIRKMGNAVDAMQESIVGIGIRVIDRTNEDFHPGLPDKVVTEEPTEGISKDRIIRTIRPTIMYHQTMVQRGEIDIAVPVSSK